MTFSGLEVGGAVGSIMAAIWIYRITTIGAYLKAMAVVIVLSGGLAAIGVIEVTVHFDRFVEVAGWLYELARSLFAGVV